MKYIGIIAVCLFLCSCAQPRAGKSEIAPSEVKQAIDDQVYFYQREDRDNLFIQ